jgi:capsular polysaccharide biosynthesis protein
MAVVTDAPGLPLWSDYPRFVRRRIRPIGLLTALGLLVGLALSWMQPVTYSATASVVLTAVPKYLTPSTTTLVPPPVTIDTDAQLLRSTRVLSAVAEALGGTVDAADDHLSVTASANSEVLHVTVRAASGSAAAAAANAAVAALASVRRSTLGSLRVAQVRELRMLIDYQEQQVAKEQAQEVVVPGYDAVAADVLQLRNDLLDLEAARAHPLDVVGAAVPPRHADYPNAEVPVVSGAMVGLMCGLLLGAARDRAGRSTSRQHQHAHRSHPMDGLREATATDEDYHHAV